MRKFTNRLALYAKEKTNNFIVWVLWISVILTFIGFQLGRFAYQAN
ncbi:hypothetical protein OIU83_22575 [Flavobacterium sp. LS1R49]|uniref:Uncharacterized protein n=1 Tax=Flavobacterium shii TaxID=2987687 RepID=A0A9X3C876_9FLAO|nr:hypothetical protein [Flavobacterium shii]MCV9930463.1 hypothetical protein [Flavobacterium shii]